MYRRPRFLEVLDEVRQEMSREADFNVDLFAELVRNNKIAAANDETKKRVEIKNSIIEEPPKTKK